MNKRIIETCLAWMRRAYPKEARDITVDSLFIGAFHAHFKVCDEYSQERITCDIEAFNKYGTVPVYIDRFVRTLWVDFVKSSQLGRAAKDPVIREEVIVS